MRHWPAVAALAMLGACSRGPAHRQTPSSPAPTPAAPATPAATAATGSAALPAPELAGVATAAGGWTVQQSGDGDQAVFGIAGQPPQFALRCDAKARQIVFTRAAAGPPAKSMQIVAADGAATFPAEPTGDRRARASDFVTDTFLTQVLAEATGRIGVKLDSGPTLAMPADPVIGQTIRRCAAPRG